MFTFHLINSHDPRRRLKMELIMLVSHESLVTEVKPEVADLACILEIPYEIDKSDDHIYVHGKGIDSTLTLNSYYARRGSDHMVSTKIFCEILMDVKSGLTLLEAFNKQGYTFNC